MHHHTGGLVTFHLIGFDGGEAPALQRLNCGGGVQLHHIRHDCRFNLLPLGNFQRNMGIHIQDGSRRFGLGNHPPLFLTAVHAGDGHILKAPLFQILQCPLLRRAQ